MHDKESNIYKDQAGTVSTDYFNTCYFCVVLLFSYLHNS